MKRKNFSQKDVRLSKYAKALSHPARIEILKYLAEVNMCPFHVVAEEIPLANSTISQHLDSLKESGLVQSIVSKPFVNYYINKKKWKEARKLINSLINIRISKRPKNK